MDRKVKIRIDGRMVEAPEGSTILDVARQEGIYIPTLCHSPLLRPLENCRLCVVSVAGEPKYKAACSTMIVEDMDITTSSEGLRQTRKLLLELLLDTHYGDCIAPCTVTCPANVDIQGYLAYIRKGEYHEAVECIKKNIPMPLTIGRVCPHPCESSCRRHLVEEPININHCKRFVADYEMGKGNKVLPEVGPESGKRVAIIGGGPAGLSAAFYLRSNGHACTIFDAKDKLGGMLRYGIPEYRLPKATLDWEIDGILSLGVEVRYEKRWGKDFTLEDLKKEGFDAIFLGIGAWASNKLGVQGEELDGVWGGIDFLDLVASGKPPKLGQHVVIIGGGNTAIDAARTALRLGVPKVTILYRRTKKEMPANPEEIHAAEHEKVDIQILAAPTRLIGENGTLKEIEFLRMELGEPDASGRRRPVPVPGSETTMAVDQVINAIGQAPKLPTVEQDVAMSNIPTTRWNTFGGNDRSQHTGQEMIFTGGDAFRGPMTVVAALADGRKAAYAIDSYFRTGQIEAEPIRFNISKGTLKTIDPEPFNVFPKAERQRMPELPVEQAVKSFDAVELGFSEEQAKQEADRCLVCGCSAAFDCRLRDAMDEFKVNWVDQTGRKILYTTVKEVDSNSEIAFDPNKCIRCQRCQVACATFQCSDAIDLKDVYPTWITDKCVACGLCVDLCPTGALLVKRNGRAVDRLDWRRVTTHCINCGVGCQVELNVSGERQIWISDSASVAPGWASTCRKGRFGANDGVWYGDRVSKAMIRPKKSLKEVSLSKAIEEVVKGFSNIAEQHGAKALGALASPKSTNEALYLLQRWWRTGWKSHELDFPGREVKEKLWGIVRGDGKMKSVKQDSSPLDRARAIFVVGDGVEETAPVVATMIRRAFRHGVPVWQLSTKPDELTPFSSLAVHTASKSWKELLKGLGAAMLQSGRVSDKDLRKAGADLSFTKDGKEFTPSAKTIPAETWNALKKGFQEKAPIAIVFQESLLELKDTKDVVKLLSELKTLSKLAAGGKEETGFYPLTDAINSSGALLMGVSPNYLPGFAKIDKQSAKKFMEAWQVQEIPDKPFHGIDSALEAKRIKGLFVQDAASLFNKDAARWKQLLSQVEFLVVQEMVPSPAIDLAHVVLPAAAFGEQKGTVLSQEGYVLTLDKVFDSPGKQPEDWEVLTQIMAAQGISIPGDMNAVHHEISKLVPVFSGFAWGTELKEKIC